MIGGFRESHIVTGHSSLLCMLQQQKQFLDFQNRGCSQFNHLEIVLEVALQLGQLLLEQGILRIRRLGSQ